MRHSILLTFTLISVGLSLVGQEYELRPYSRGQLTTNVGYRFGGTNLNRGFITDALIEVGFDQPYWQLISFKYFFFPHWGLECTIEPMFQPNSNAVNTAEFVEDIKKEYGADYFYEIQYFNGYSDSPLMYLGVVYRFQNNRFQGQVKGLFSYLDLNLAGAKVDLKEKGSHQTLNLHYGHTIEKNNSFGPSVTLGYRLYKVFMLNINLTYLYTSTEFNYTKTTTDPYTETTSSQIFNYKTDISTFSASIGLTIEFGSFGNKR